MTQMISKKEADDLRKAIFGIQNPQEENGQPKSIRLILVLLANGEVLRTAEVDYDPSQDAMMVSNLIVTTDLLRTLQETPKGMSIEFVMIATTTGMNLTT